MTDNEPAGKVVQAELTPSPRREQTQLPLIELSNQLGAKELRR